MDASQASAGGKAGILSSSIANNRYRTSLVTSSSLSVFTAQHSREQILVATERTTMYTKISSNFKANIIKCNIHKDVIRNVALMQSNLMIQVKIIKIVHG